MRAEQFARSGRSDTLNQSSSEGEAQKGTIFGWLKVLGRHYWWKSREKGVERIHIGLRCLNKQIGEGLH